MIKTHAEIRTKSTPRVAPDYLKLVRRFPIRPIRNLSDHAEAIEVLHSLVGRVELTRGQLDYLDALAYFVETYERENTTLKLEAMTPIELLRHLMEQNGMNITDLGYVVGSRGLASEILSGKRGLSKTIIGRLSAHFRVSPVLFLDVSAATSGKEGD